MQFSDRMPRELAPNAIAMAHERCRAEGVPLLDLCTSNPTQVGLDFGSSCAELARALAAGAFDPYRPDARGLVPAREAVARHSEGRFVVSQLTLTSSSSESYALLFKLLCSPGDEVLVPKPSYPLLDHLTALEGVRAVPYGLHYAGEWLIDLDAVEWSIGSRTRALVVVNPNNPTGNYLKPGELAALRGLCARRGIALISDEVFWSYPLVEGQTSAPTVAEVDDCLCFVLDGLSKAYAWPQLKLGWIATNGPAALRDEAQRRLELVADMFLSVGSPVMAAAERILETGLGRRRAIATRLHLNDAALRGWQRAHPAMSYLAPEGGWSAVLQVPSLLSEQQLVLGLLSERGVLMHPGYFFDLGRSGTHLVASLLVPPATLRQGLDELAAHLGL